MHSQQFPQYYFPSDSLRSYGIIFRAPPRCLITAFPFLLDVSQLFLHSLHRLRITRVLPNIIADLDCRPASSARQLDDDVQRYGLLARAEMHKIVGKECTNTKRGFEASCLGYLLVSEA